MDVVSNEATDCQNANSVQGEEKMMDDTKDNLASEGDSANTWKAVGSLESETDGAKNDGFLSPMSLPPVAKSVIKKAQESKPVSMAFKSKFAIPADIYKAPRIMAFTTDVPRQTKPKDKAVAEDNVEATSQSESKESDANKKSRSKPKPPPAKLSYEPPGWGSSVTEDKYSFEVLKMGSIVDQVKLSGKEYFLVGRLPDCDIKMEHPSISRYHAVLQYGAPDAECANVELQKDGSSGFYVFDLGSTHGTIINKQTVQPKTFYRIKVGHVLKFGGSTRLFILQGPVDDQEEEAKESATELRAINKSKIKKKKDLERMMLGEDSSDEDDDNKKEKAQKGAESSGVTWGMLEDAVQSSSSDEEEEEEAGGDTRADHPDAVLVQTKKDPFYMKDPMKALKNLYEREKLELDFECDERRSGHWHVRLCLPVDSPSGKPIYAEVNATGKKKDTMRQCALEACRILEKHGLFHHKDHQKQRVKQWEQDDYYDSGEDEFHDRTGELEIKRTMRMKRAGRKSKSANVVETFESLVKKVTALDNEIKDIEMKLQKDKEATKVNADADDPLDAFMQQVKSGKALDTTTRSKLKRRLFDARKEHMRVSKLADLARPSSLPPLASSSAKTPSFIGKMKGLKKPLMKPRPTVQVDVESASTKEEKDEVVEEEEEDEDAEKEKSVESAQTGTKIVKLMDITPETKRTTDVVKVKTETVVSPAKTNIEKPEPPLETKKMSLVGNGDKDIEKTEPTLETKKMSLVGNGDKDIKKSVTVTKPSDTENESRKRILGPSLPPEVKEHLQDEPDKPSEEVLEEEPAEPKRKRRRQRKPRPAPKTKAQYSDDPKYSVWLPPEDQSGDGKTSLNEKLGY